MTFARNGFVRAGGWLVSPLVPEIKSSGLELKVPSVCGSSFLFERR